MMWGYEWLGDEREKGEEIGKPHGKTPRKYTPHYKDERRDRYNQDNFVGENKETLSPVNKFSPAHPIPPSAKGNNLQTPNGIIFHTLTSFQLGR